jgi:hypothetical protein
MTGLFLYLFPYLTTAVLLLVVVAHLFRQRAIEDQNLGPSVEDEQETAVKPNEIPQQLTLRLFRPEDWDFVSRQGSARLQRLFLQQRTALARAWLRRVRANVRALMRIHRAAARMSSQLRLREELKVACEYLLFQMVCQCIALLIWVRGPVDLSHVIGCAEGLSERISKIVTRLNPAESEAHNNTAGPHPFGGTTQR